MATSAQDADRDHWGASKLDNFLISLSGARSEILAQCPTERLKFQSLGWAILITSGIATVSMWFALYSALGVNPFVAVLPALMWGLVIMGIDRWLVTSMPVGSSRRWTMALPRVLLALLLGSLISTPLVLRIFQSEINTQISVIRAQRASTFLSEQQHSQVGRQVNYWRADVANLQKVIDSGGYVTINPSTDPQVQSLTKQRTAEQAQEQRYYQQWQCQLYGGKGCSVKGNGPLAKASEASYHQAKAQVATLTQEIRQRERQLSATDAASKRARYSQAGTALPAAQQQLKVAVARENELQQTFDARNESTNGLLIRLEALNQLSGKSLTLNGARLLLFLLFLVIECLPVTVKVLQRPGNYERILETAAEAELKQANRAYRRMRPSATSRGAAAAADSRPAAANPEEAVRGVWRRLEPKVVSDWPGGLPTETLPRNRAEQPDDSEVHARLDDDALRRMDDLRDGREWGWDGASYTGETLDPGRPGQGIELNYGDDDL